MYRKPTKHSFLEKYNVKVSKTILECVINKAILEEPQCKSSLNSNLRLSSSQPQCFAPHVDFTRAKCAYGTWVLPKLKAELNSTSPLIVRQAVTTLADLVMQPEKLIEMIELQIPDRLSDFLVSKDSYLRERVAMIYITVASQTAGRETILQNSTTLSNVKKGLTDRLTAVRIKMAQVVEMLARCWMAAEELCIRNFADCILSRITIEKNDVLTIHLETLQNLFDHDIKADVIKNGAIEKLMLLLRRKDKCVLYGTLAYLSVLCQETLGKEKSLELDLLSSLKMLLNDDHTSIQAKTASVLSFITITNAGKLRVVKLKMIPRLVHLATDWRCQTLQLAVMKTLTNLAESPEGRKILLERYAMIIEDIDVCDAIVERHKKILIDTIRWRP